MLLFTLEYFSQKRVQEYHMLFLNDICPYHADVLDIVRFMELCRKYYSGRTYCKCCKCYNKDQKYPHIVYFLATVEP